MTRDELIAAAIQALVNTNTTTYIDADQDIADCVLSEVVTIVVDAVLRAQMSPMG